MTSNGARSFREIYDGFHSGLIQWEDYEQVMAKVAESPEGWFVYDTREAPPTAPEPAALLPERLAAITRVLRDTHRADYCGFVYADDRAAPVMIKVYNPRNASACGSAAAPVPLYLLSRIRPEALPLASEDAPRPGLVARLFNRQS